MSEDHIGLASDHLSKPDHASNVDKDETQTVHSTAVKNRNDDLEDIDTKHEHIPYQIEVEHEHKSQVHNRDEETKSRNDAMSPKTNFTESHNGFHAKNGLAHLPTEANETNETMHTHDVNSLFRDPFGSTHRQEMKHIGIGTADDFEVSY